MKYIVVLLALFLDTFCLLAQQAPVVDSFMQPTAEQTENAVVGTLAPHLVNTPNSLPNSKPAKVVNANYPGGERAMVESINRNLKYPKACEAKKKEGVAEVSFFIEPDGTCSNYKIESEPCDGMGNEVIRVLKLLKKWNPARVDGVATRQQYRFPVNFRLNTNIPPPVAKQPTPAQIKKMQEEFNKLPLAKQKEIIAQQQKLMQQQQAQQKNAVKKK